MHNLIELVAELYPSSETLIGDDQVLTDTIRASLIQLLQACTQVDEARKQPQIAQAAMQVSALFRFAESIGYIQPELLDYVRQHCKLLIDSQ